MSTKADAKLQRGTKRMCQNPQCGSRFYDLNREPITCPICNTVLCIQQAMATDVVFDPIPVNVTGLGTLITRVGVTCQVLDKDGLVIPTQATLIGGKPITSPVDATGAFSGDFAQGLNYTSQPASLDAAKATTYRRTLSCINAGGESPNCAVGDGSQWWHVKSGTLQIQAPLP